MNAKILGANLSLILDEKGITKSSFARSVGIDRSYVTQIIQGKKENISDKVLKRMARALDISRDDVLKLALPETDPSAIAKKEKASIRVPLFFKLSKLTVDIIQAIQTRDVIEQSAVLPNFISFPKCEPFSIMSQYQYMAILVDTDPGMAPKIQKDDIVTVNLDLTTPTDQAIHLVASPNGFTFRYAKVQDSLEVQKFIMFWAEDRSIGTDCMPVGKSPYPIFGTARTHTRML